MSESVHEPAANLMSAEEVWLDAQQVADILRRNLLKTEPSLRVQIPFSTFLSALGNLNRDELVILRRRVEDLLTA
jgi:hypothetical protein